MSLVSLDGLRGAQCTGAASTETSLEPLLSYAVGFRRGFEAFVCLPQRDISHLAPGSSGSCSPLQLSSPHNQPFAVSGMLCSSKCSCPAPFPAQPSCMTKAEHRYHSLVPPPPPLSPSPSPSPSLCRWLIPARIPADHERGGFRGLELSNYGSCSQN